MKNSLKNQILDMMRNHGTWLHGEEITRYGQSIGYEGESCRRRLRDLLKENLVIAKWIKGPHVASKMYMATGPMKTTVYKLPDGTVIHTKKTYS